MPSVEAPPTLSLTADGVPAVPGAPPLPSASLFVVPPHPTAMLEPINTIARKNALCSTTARFFDAPVI
ncbi:MAG TPA: hypothetical protein VH062_20885 [Polyangiaceae bacterium]|nr:hypothetical protein [Polyangiaceae bacterium]